MAISAKNLDYIQTEDKSFIRNTKSAALLNTDRNALQRSRAIRTKAREELSLKYQVQALQKEVKELRDWIRMFFPDSRIHLKP